MGILFVYLLIYVLLCVLIYQSWRDEFWFILLLFWPIGVILGIIGLISVGFYYLRRVLRRV